METRRNLTAQEALSRPLFHGAELIAGAGGLSRTIRWVHILEITSFETLIHGEEMILTTGMGFQLTTDSSVAVAFVQALMDRNAACLCIELGPNFPAAPPELIELADRHNFPIILFPHTVRYVDITQDLHSIIINRHHLMLQELERLSREFHRLTLASQGALSVLKLLHKSTQAQLLYRPLTGKPIFFPPAASSEQTELLRIAAACSEEMGEIRPNAAPYLHEEEDRYFVLKPIGALEQTWATIMMVCTQRPGEFDYLLLDSAALSIAQELLRTRYMEERKLFSENLWMGELLNGGIEDEKQLKTLIGPDFKRLNESHYRVCLIEIDNLYDESLGMSDHEWEAVRIHLSLMLRSAMEKQAFRPLITLKNNRLVVIAFDLKSKLGSRARLTQALSVLWDIQGDERLKGLKLQAGVGQSHQQLRYAYDSYQEAIQALALHASYEQPVLFYEELGVFQLLLRLNDGQMLQQFIRGYLGPLLDHDQNKGSDLLLTLKVYLDHDGSKQIAAQKLFIVRQSLYYRLEKIAELLGEGFMSPENRIAIQVALRAYQLLHPEKFQGARRTNDRKPQRELGG
ncbi:purine catabolism regulator [Paenibacillus phyllosphaerae]|uniref:Purine catabolism regulator n=1 Tax=Paenibacillus phyllosphaerae TaxID=274593 RepID=A0A7W5AYE6_9BACL|nr:PucR family transcriptional regulator [Paenibacillus phyllosphaerae]MBB3110769.1 purine catabolism regulator [Paenibacillus phyllosphaerae]